MLTVRLDPTDSTQPSAAASLGVWVSSIEYAASSQTHATVRVPEGFAEVMSSDSAEGIPSLCRLLDFAGFTGLCHCGDWQLRLLHFLANR